MYPVCKLCPLFLFLVCVCFPSGLDEWNCSVLMTSKITSAGGAESSLCSPQSGVLHTDVCNAHWVHCAQHKILQLDLNPSVIKSHPFWLNALQVVFFFCFFLWRGEFAKIFHMHDTHNNYFLLNLIQRKTRKSRYVQEYWLMFDKNVAM